MQVDWRKLGSLPLVSPWIKGRRSYTWEQRRDEYAALPKAPIVITAELVTPVLHAEPGMSHLDGILAAAAITDHPHPSAWDKRAVVPLPLELVWISDAGLPLWAAGPLAPVGDSVDGREYWHKRYPSHRAELGNKLSASTTSGRWREYRMPVSAQSASRLRAIAIGNRAEVQRLLDGITHIGKKGSMGYGRVARWIVDDADHDLEDVLRRRPVPVESGLPGGDRIEPRRGWTPPYWYAPDWADCRMPA